MSPRSALPLGGHGDIRVQKIEPKAAETKASPTRVKAIAKSVTWRASARIRLRSGQITQREAFSRESGDRARARLRLVLADPETYASRSLRPRGEERLSGAMTLEAFLPVWIASETTIRPQTLNEYVRIARKNVIGDGGLGSLQLREIDVPTISEFLTALLHGTESTPARPSIAKQARVVLAKVMGYALRRGLITVNPVHDATTVTIKTSTPKSITSDQAQELRRLTRQWARTEDAAANPYADVALLPDFVDALIGTAARTSELLAWRWDEDIDLNADPPTIAISGTIVFIKGGDGSGTSTVRQDDTKSSRGMRGVTMPAPIVQMMRRRLAARQPGHDFVFGHKHGQALSPSSFRILWRAAIAGTALEGTTPRAGRKLGATAVANAHGAERAAGQMGNTRQIAEKHYIEKSNLHDNRDIFEALLAMPVDDLEIEMLAKLNELQAAAVDLGIDELRVGGILDRLADAGAQLTVHLESAFAHASEIELLTAVEEILGAPVTLTFDGPGYGYSVLNAFSGPETLGMPFS